MGTIVEEPQTWRELLKRIIGDTQERQRIAAAMEVNTITLARWARGSITPRLDSLLQLIEHIPLHYSSSLRRMLIEEYPHLAEAIEQRGDRVVAVIPPAFYARVLNIHTSSPPNLRIEALRAMILQQLLAHLASTQRLAISLAMCVPPAVEGGQVRSLRLIVERSTPPRYFFVEDRMLFMGVESPVGQAVQMGRQYATPDQHEQHWIASCYGIASSGSFVATPIVRGTGVAGCLALFSPEANFFTPDHLQLVRSYTELLTLAFEGHEFFEQDQIALGAMPMPMRQQALLRQFQERVMRVMRQAAAEGRSLTRPLAEARVWQELGNELLLQDEAQ